MLYTGCGVLWLIFFFFQAEDGIRDLVRSRGLGDVYKRQLWEGLVLAIEPFLSTGATFAAGDVLVMSYDETGTVNTATFHCGFNVRYGTS